MWLNDSWLERRQAPKSNASGYGRIATALRSLIESSVVIPLPEASNYLVRSSSNGNRK